LNVPSSSDRVERALQEPGTSREAILSLVGDRLRRVEGLFRDNLSSPIRIVDEIGSFVAHAGGKRVRPTLHLLAARLCEYDGPHDVVLATVLEFIHSATLIHDDIIDEATVRRGRPSVNFQWGNKVTVLFGDYLYAKAMQMALSADSQEVMDALARATLRMIEGELLQTRYAGRIDLGEVEYLDLIERKTAALFSCCCELAGLLSGQDGDRLGALRGYGLDLGLAFQIVDDLLDLTASAGTLGKPSTADLREGKVTLAVIDLLSRGDARDRDLVQRVMGDCEDGAAPQLKRRLDESGALVRCRLRAEGFATSAKLKLRRFPEGPARRALEGLSGLVLHRDR
jgi:octaprenyl-diphosphate synthase